MIKCKLTGITGAPINAHIVPRSFYQFSTSNPGPAYILRSQNGETRRTKSPIGEYDSTILTIEGERLLADLDDYAAAFLIRKESGINEIHHDGASIEGFSINDFDYEKLKLFFLSLLWRTSVSSRESFAAIKLRPEQERDLARRIVGRNPGSKAAYPIVLAMHPDTPDEGGFPLISPIKKKVDEHLFACFYLRYFVVYIGIDSKPLTGVLLDLAMEEGMPLTTTLLAPFRESPNGGKVIAILREANPSKM